MFQSIPSASWKFVCQFTWNNNTVQSISKYSVVLDHKVEKLGLYNIQSFSPRQSLLAGEAIEEILRSVDDYEHAFHKFGDAHENYLRFEDEEGMEAVAKESYKNEIERKFLLDVDINE